MQQNIYNAVHQGNAPKAECDSYLIIRGSSNINQFQFISYQPETINSENLDKNKTYRDVKIKSTEFSGISLRTSLQSPKINSAFISIFIFKNIFF